MIEIEEMRESEAREVLGTLDYAHLAVAKDNIPYVVPVHFAFDGANRFVYTTEGKKADIIRVNPEICLQAEDVQDNENWKSVMVVGTAQQLTSEDDRQKFWYDFTARVQPGRSTNENVRRIFESQIYQARDRMYQAKQTEIEK